MNKYLIRAALIVALSFCLAITTYADPTASVGDSGVSFSIATSQEDFKYSGHYAYGVRMGLYDAESGDLIKSSNWLNTDPVEPYYALGSNVKYSSKNYVSWDSMFSYEPTSGLPTTGSGASAKEWAKSEQTLQALCEVFGTTPEDFQSGKYLIGIEPIQQMNIGWTSHTVIGTATEIATYINNEFIEQFNSEIVKQVEEKLKNSSLTPSQKKATIQLARMKLLTNSTAEKLVRENMGNLTHHDLPCSFFLDPENPDGPDLGFSRVTDGFASCSEIRSQGYGLFILYADCQYRGKFAHGSPEAKDLDHPDHEPDQPPCTCPEISGCPYNGPWSGETDDKADPWSPIGKWSEKTPYTNAKKAPANYNGLKVEGSLSPHGTEEAHSQGCICESKKKKPVAEVNSEPIKKDFLNRQYKSGEVDPCPSHPGHESVSGGGIANDKSKHYTVHEECSSYYVEFIGDRGFTANSESTNLIVSGAHLENPNPQDYLPETIKTMNGIQTQFEQNHDKDVDKNVTVEFKESSGSHDCGECECSGHGTDEDGNDSYCGGCECPGYTSSATPESFIYSAEPTYFAKSKSKNYKTFTTVAMEYGKNAKTVSYIALDKQKSYTFYPQYQMSYYPAVTGDPQKIWMLASGERTLNMTPVITISESHIPISALSPWSRDYEDVQQSLEVTKAGNAFKIYPTGKKEITYKITMEYLIKDEFFEDGKNYHYTTNKEFDKYFDNVVKEIENLHMFSNVPYTGDHAGLIFNNLGLRNIFTSKPDLLRKSFIEGEYNAKLIKTKSGETKVVRSNFVGGKDSTSKSTVNGKEPGVANVTFIKDLLVTSPSGHSWYEEDYEGFFYVTRQAEVVVEVPDNTWLEIYRDISDWRTPYNTKDNPVTINKLSIYKGKNFVIGWSGWIPTYSIPAYNAGGSNPVNKFDAITVPNVPTPNNYYEFMIRGSAYDQH